MNKKIDNGSNMLTELQQKDESNNIKSLQKATVSKIASRDINATYNRQKHRKFC